MGNKDTYPKLLKTEAELKSVEEFNFNNQLLLNNVS